MAAVIKRRFSDEFHGEDTNLELFFEACSKKGQENSAVNALMKGIVDVNSRGVFGNTALHFAAHSGNIEGMKFLISKGAEVDARNDLQVTPLGKAVVEGQIEAIKYLISVGADIDAIDDIPGTPLMAAVRRGRTDVVSLLLRKGACVNMEDTLGNTALHLAAKEGHISTVQLLLDFGADPDHYNIRHQRPADVAEASWIDSYTKKKIHEMLSSHEDIPSF